MRVSQFMQKSVVCTSRDEPVRNVAKLIFNLGFNGVPVVEKGKLVGIISETDILKKLFPSMRDFVEDSLRSHSFEEMEHNLTSLLDQPVKKIMSNSVYTVYPDTPVLKAQSKLILYGIHRLSVIDKNKKLVGIISQGDIFRAIIGEEIPYDDNEEYHAWQSHLWDLVVPWKERLKTEMTDFDELFERKNVFRVMDIFCGTGEHDIALAKRGYDVLGLNKYTLMHDKAIDKYAHLPGYIKKHLDFQYGDYIDVLKNKTEDFDAAIFMGNSLPHNVDDYKKLLRAVSNSLTKKDAVMVLQISNFKKIINVNSGFQDFNLGISKISEKIKYAFIEHYDAPSKPNGPLTLNMTVLQNRGKRWTHSAMNSTPIANISEKKIVSILSKLGFKVKTHGSNFLKPQFSEKFSPLEHDWLNVIAER